MNKELTEHCGEVSGFAMDIAYELELCPFYIAEIGLAAQYHDIGKEYIPEDILNKPGKLTDDEIKIMRTHTTIGFSLLKSAYTDLGDITAEVALNHHENYDGSGYHGKKNKEISMASRIIRVADVFSALTTDRVYRPAWKIEDVINYIGENSCKLFDPIIVVAFFSVIEGYADNMREKANKIKEAYGWS